MTFIVKLNNKNLQIVIQADFLCDVLEYVQNDNDDIWEKGQPPPLLNVQVKSLPELSNSISGLPSYMT